MTEEWGGDESLFCKLIEEFSKERRSWLREETCFLLWLYLGNIKCFAIHKIELIVTSIEKLTDFTLLAPRSENVNHGEKWKQNFVQFYLI